MKIKKSQHQDGPYLWWGWVQQWIERDTRRILGVESRLRFDLDAWVSSLWEFSEARSVLSVLCYTSMKSFKKRLHTFCFNDNMKKIIKEKYKMKVTRCFNCYVVRPLNSHHCCVCHKCFIEQDHHCPWVNNCIGLFNKKFFLLFLSR